MDLAAAHTFTEDSNPTLPGTGDAITYPGVLRRLIHVLDRRDAAARSRVADEAGRLYWVGLAGAARQRLPRHTTARGAGLGTRRIFVVLGRCRHRRVIATDGGCPAGGPLTSTPRRRRTS